jgi:hypothetical protein
MPTKSEIFRTTMPRSGLHRSPSPGIMPDMEKPMTDTININIIADPEEILGGNADWSAELEIELRDGEATIRARDVHNSTNGTPMDEWHGLIRCWSNRLSAGSAVLPDPDKIAQLAERAKPLLARVAAGHSVEWDGRNMVGRLTRDAQAASEELAELMWMRFDLDWTRDDVLIDDAWNWLHDVPLAELGVTVDSTDEEIDNAAAEIEDRARLDEARIIGGTDAIASALREKRDDARAEAEAEA